MHLTVEIPDDFAGRFSAADADTGRGDEFVSGIAGEIQFGGLFTDGQIKWPHLHPGKYPHKLGGPNLNRNPAQLCQLGNLPQNDCRYAPWFRGKQLPFGRRQ